MTLRTMEAVIIFCDRDLARAATADLIENDCEVEELDLTDPRGGSNVWLKITVATELTPEGSFNGWMSSIGHSARPASKRRHST
jgi:hypothetical protein